MYISKIKIEGFRNFKSKEILFNDGINVIIGHNNAGKTNLLKAMALVIDIQTPKRLVIDDFFKNTSLSELQANPPSVQISLYFSQSNSEDLLGDDLVTVGSWLTKLEQPYEAQLTYEFFLPEREKQHYIQELSTATTLEQAWLVIKHDFIRLFVSKIYGGDPALKSIADADSLQKFDFQFLNAIRDVERDMFTGRNTLLREVLDFFMDYEIKSVPEATKDKATKIAEIKAKKIAFSGQAQLLMQELQIRMQSGKGEILSYASDTGASFNNATPDFEGSISEVELYSALRLIVEHETGIKIPATHNGLGYNNLIYMSLLLAKMQVDSNGEYLGSNAKVFPILGIEEPEAHLHPSMQYKFLKFLKENKDVKKKVRQIFVSTHSTHITSAVSLDEIICLHNQSNDTSVAYPGKVFPRDNAGQKSKAYVKRFLDATRSDMLFAQKIILVEGIAEQLLLSILSEYSGKSLEDNHIAVINVGGRYFDHFLYLFDTLVPFTIPKRIACITDRDPLRKNKAGGNYQKCYPFEYDADTTKYDYKENASSNITRYAAHPNIRFFSQDPIRGKTFEYDLLYFNPSLELLLTDSITNKTELEKLMKLFTDNKQVADFITELRSSPENSQIIDSINFVSAPGWDDLEKKKAIISARYLNSVGKGENALELASVLEGNYRDSARKTFNVPDYIKHAIDWICQ